MVVRRCSQQLEEQRAAQGASLQVSRSQKVLFFFCFFVPEIENKKKSFSFPLRVFFLVAVFELTHFLSDVVCLASRWFFSSVLKVVVKQQLSVSSLELAALSSPKTQHFPQITALEFFSYQTP